MSEEVHKQQLKANVENILDFPTEDPNFINHVTSILLEEPPISGNEIYEMISDFFEIFQIGRADALKKCDLLFQSMKAMKNFLKS